MKVLSLFDGISCGQEALKRAGIYVDTYYASEIDKAAITTTQRNHPATVQLGDIREIKGDDWYKALSGVDLIIGGSPCQDLSVAKANREGLKGERSSLFFEYLRLVKELKPRWFILENVASMRKEDRNKISKAIGVEPIIINAALVSAQNRKRYFWTNIDIQELPVDRNIKLKDILEDKSFTVHEKSYCITASYHKKGISNFTQGDSEMVFSKPIQITKINNSQAGRVYSIDGKSVSIKSCGGGQGAKTGLYEVLKGYARKLTAVECERLQGLPDNYTEGFANTVRYRMIGNAFNVDVVAHILKYIKE